MAKGGNFEREIAKKLSLWWTDGKTDAVFWRTSGSGARATVRKKVGKATANQDGDICATDPIGQPLIDLVTIELKVGYNSWNIKELLDSKKKQTILEDFWEQCIREQDDQKRRGWWLIVRQDRRNELLFFDEGFYRFQRHFLNALPEPNIRVNWRGQFIFCVRLDDFLTVFRPEFIFNR